MCAAPIETRGADPGEGSLGLIEQIASGFAIPRPVERIAPLGRGLINETFRVQAGPCDYVLQRLNPRVFPDPLQIMRNLQRLAAHATRHPPDDLHLPRLVPTHAGATALQDATGGIWRLMEFITNTISLPSLASPAQAREVGLLLGRFHSLLQTLPSDAMGITLPGFHETPGYLARLDACHATVDPGEQDDDLAACLGFVETHRELSRCLADAQAAGRIPVRIIHGDPKLDNMLFDSSDGRARALIDLDTVQPGLILHDIGDCLRSCCNRRGETAAGGGVCFDLDLAAPLLRAYAQQTRHWLLDAERNLIPNALALMPFELGLRFLTDHLDGNRYFKITEPHQNLRKAAVQFALVRDIEAKAESIQALVEDAFTTARQPLIQPGAHGDRPARP
ncbi:hypothetical protein CKO25_00250 [Thiocapsa imhoffii]|uniref:Aminoglycoside phosphotransferase domain-containing protein n=2 Tax=Thiocapsa imhoffii TaxID=382777 RepID=A0A9X0WEL0_9GAMM|nr:hypothetical protein [Thiocapsa imhoffii]